MCLAQGLKHSDAGEARAHGPSILSQAHFEADFLWKVSLKILNSGLILKTFTNAVLKGYGNTTPYLSDLLPFHLGQERSFYLQGSYRQDCVKFKDFSRTSKRLSYCFQGLKTYEKYGFTR